MLLEYEQDFIRELRFDERLCRVGDNPQAWQFKEIYDAATLGFEIFWPYEDCVVTKKSLSFPKEVVYDVLSKDLFAINFPSHIRVKESYKLMIFPHHTTFFAMSSWASHNVPIAIPQIIEADWWPGTLRVIFVRRRTIFEKGTPIAQGLVIPKRDTVIKKMENEEVARLEKSWKYIVENKEQYATRCIQIEGFSEQDNLYARLSELNCSDSLPSEIKEKKTEPVLRISWK